MTDRWLNMTHGFELKSDINTGRRKNENGILFFSHYMVLRKYLGQTTQKDKDQFFQVCLNLRSHKLDGSRTPGLFDRGQDESLNATEHVRKISHDNLSAIVRVSNDHSLGFNEHIAKHLLNNKTLFDNAKPDTPRLIYKSHTGKKSTTSQFHPRDWFYWLFLGGYKKLAMLFFPIFFISQITTCFSDLGTTSGKLLMFNKLFNRKELPLKITWKICNYILKKKYKTDNWMIPVTDIYFFQDYNNPIRILVRQIEVLK